MLRVSARRRIECNLRFFRGMFMLLRYFRLWAILLIAGISSAAAQDTSPEDGELQKAFVAAINVANHGPADVALRVRATIHRPDSHSFVPVKEGAALMRAMGNTTDETFYGLIMSKKHDQYWFVTIDYQDSGHVKDDDGKSWNAD